jgi:hypothetical protein
MSSLFYPPSRLAASPLASPRRVARFAGRARGTRSPVGAALARRGGREGWISPAFITVASYRRVAQHCGRLRGVWRLGRTPFPGV